MADNRYVVRLRGLPWAATDHEITQFLNVEIANGEEGIRRVYTDDQKPSGEAFVEVLSENDMQTCFEKDHNLIGKRYIEVFPSSVKEMEYILGPRDGPEENPTYVDAAVKLRGLPFQCSKEEVAQFFSGLDIVPNGITLPLDDHGRSTGEAFVEFRSSDSADKALGKHKEKIGHRYIEIFRSSKRDVRVARGEWVEEDRGPWGKRPGPYDRPVRGVRGMRGQRMARGAPRYTGGYGDGDFYEEDSMENNGSWRNWRGRGRGGMKAYDGRNQNSVGYGNYGGGNYGGDNYGGDNFEEGYYQDEYNEEYYEEENVPAPPSSFIVRMRGLPFKCTEQEIFNFFSPIVPVRVRLEYGDDGRVSGEGVVSFASYQDAEAAMQKNKERIQHRYIELFMRGNQRGGFRGGRPMRGGSRGRGVAGYRY